MKTRHRHQDAVLIIADMMWALRRLGAHVFFPEYKLPQAQRFILVGSALGYAELRGRPLTLTSLSLNIAGRFNLAQGIIGTASGIGAALSTALFGLIAANFDRTATFLSMASVALLGASIMWLLMPETRPSTESNSSSDPN